MTRLISAQTVAVVEVLRTGRQQWLSSLEVHRRVPTPVAHRTVRDVLHRLAKAGVVQYMEVFPGRRYQLAKTSAAEEYLKRVGVAEEVLGLK